MRLRRRVAFAAPFVLVMSCGSKPEPQEPERDDEKKETVATQPEPGLIDTSHFPTHRDPPPEPEPVDCNAPGARCTYNPPRPPKPPPPPPCGEGSTCNPPGPVRGKVIHLEVVDAETAITIDRGTSSGVTPGTKACVLVVNSSTKCMVGGHFTIARVNERSSIGKVKLTPDQVQQSRVVRIDRE